MNADGSDSRLLAGHQKARFLDPVSSPDGSKIAFASDRIPFNFEIWAMDADGSSKQRLTDNPAMDSNPVWSADGSAILFESWRDGNLEIYRMNADGSDVRRLTSNEARDSDPAP